MVKVRTLQLYRGTTAQNNAYTGFAGELTMDTTTNELRLHDGSTVGGHVIGSSGGSGGYHPDLFSWQWADHELNDVQWLRADTFSWQSGAVYETAYQHLVDDVCISVYAWSNSGGTVTRYTTSENPQVGDALYVIYHGFLRSNALIDSISDDTIITDGAETLYRQTASDTVAAPGDSNPPSTETISGTTISYYTAADGHKIVLADQESNVTAIHSATGVAWYYILDTDNQRFKLPRTQFGVTGLRDTVGKYVEAGLPNITGSAEVYWESQNATVGAFYADTSRNNSERNNNTGYQNLGFDASRSSSVYGNSTTVQPPATQMYLYFYVGSFTQTALENTAGLNASLFNGKVDIGHQLIDFQNPTSTNDYTWYRKYADGWVEQGQKIKSISFNTVTTVTLPIAMANTNYYTNASPVQIGTNTIYSAASTVSAQAKTTSNIMVGQWNTASASLQICWEVKGMAQG